MNKKEPQGKIELHLGGCKQNNQNRKFPDNEELGFLSGIHAYYEPEELVGKTLIARAMMGMESCGMLLSAVNNLKDSEDEKLLTCTQRIRLYYQHKS